jgi:hypothetical protein
VIDPEHQKLATVAVAEVCLQLAKEGCEAPEVIIALATMLGVSLANVDCCQLHQAQARATAIEELDEELAAHNQRWASYKAAAEFPTVEGHA